MKLNVQDKVFIVTGGASGIGEAICKVLSAEGAIPCILDRDLDKSKKVEQDIKNAGGQVFYRLTQLTDEEDCKKAVEEIIARFGSIDGLVNNAGLNDGVGLENGNYEDFISSLKRNVTHYFMVAHYALPALIQSKGAILNITSKVAETGQGGTSGYAAANGVRNDLTTEWSVELAKYGIRVNSIVVAECMTPQYEWWIQQQDDPQQKIKEISQRIPLENRMTTPKEIADMAAFLLSENASGITGEFIHVDGGYVHLDRRIETLTTS